MALSTPETMRLLHDNFLAHDEPGSGAFADQPAMWEKVRERTPPDQRIANNPYAFRDMTPWPVNISWALLADRRSCYAGWELSQVYTSVPHDQLYLVDSQFRRIFAGDASAEDIHQLATTYDCSTAVVTVRDGSWTRDPFAKSPDYRLVEELPDQWRIYRRTIDPARQIARNQDRNQDRSPDCPVQAARSDPRSVTLAPLQRVADPARAVPYRLAIP